MERGGEGESDVANKFPLLHQNTNLEGTVQGWNEARGREGERSECGAVIGRLWGWVNDWGL